MQKEDVEFLETLDLVHKGKLKGFTRGTDSLWRYQERICMPAKGSLRKNISEEAHKTTFSIHPTITKMYHDLKKMFWWPRMKTDVAKIVGKCLVCQKVR